MFKKIKEFFTGKPVAVVEAPYKLDTPFVITPTLAYAPAAVAAKKPRKPRTPKVETAKTPAQSVKEKAPARAKAVSKSAVVKSAKSKKI